MNYLSLKRTQQDSKEPMSFDRIALITSFLEYKRFDEETDFLVLRDDTYATFLKAEGKGTYNLNQSQRRKLLENFAQFNGQFLEDYEIISAKFPTNTERQQGYWGRRYAKWKKLFNEAQDPRIKMQMQMRIDSALHYLQDQIEIEKRLYNFDFIFVFFGDTRHQLAENIKVAKRLARDNRGDTEETTPLIFQDLTHSEKETILFRLNNPNMKME